MDQVVCAHPPLCPTTYIVHGFPRTVSDGFLQKLISSLRIYIRPLPEIQIFCIISPSQLSRNVQNCDHHCIHDQYPSVNRYNIEDHKRLYAQTEAI